MDGKRKIIGIQFGQIEQGVITLEILAFVFNFLYLDHILFIKTSKTKTNTN